METSLDKIAKGELLWYNLCGVCDNEINNIIDDLYNKDVVKKIEFEGKSYYKSKKSGIIYNMDQEVVGKWNEESQRIDFEEEEIEDEYEE